MINRPEETYLFGIPVRSYELKYFKNNSINEFLKDLNSYRLLHNGDPQTGFYSETQTLLKDQKFNDLNKEIIDCITHFSYCERHAVEDISIVSSWSNLLQEGQFIEPHMHTNSYISATIHLTEGSHLFFQRHPTEELYGFTLGVRPSQEDFIAVDCIPGNLIVFPSKLTHGVYPHSGKSPRISIALNTLPKVFGTPTAYVDLQ
jgi:uncharacterized protein (TIGR02466 family)